MAFKLKQLRNRNFELTAVRFEFRFHLLMVDGFRTYSELIFTSSNAMIIPRQILIFVILRYKHKLSYAINNVSIKYVLKLLRNVWLKILKL